MAPVDGLAATMTVVFSYADRLTLTHPVAEGHPSGHVWGQTDQDTDGPGPAFQRCRNQDGELVSDTGDGVRDATGCSPTSDVRPDRGDELRDIDLTERCDAARRSRRCAAVHGCG